jgi:RHS repeat-associated protein
VTHTYDAVGNRTVQADGGTTKNYAYDVADQLTSYPNSAGITTSCTYDGAGNLTTEINPTLGDFFQTSYTWDGENRLLGSAQTFAGNPQFSASYAYNADGQRVQTASSGSATAKYVWDGRTYLLETDSSNNPTVVYTQGSGTYGDLISQRRKSGSVWTPSYYLFDGLGSTERVLSSSQAALATYIYRAYGELVAQTGSLTNAFRYLGRWGYYLDFSGLSDYYVRARWYRPTISRWLSPDPLGLGPDINRYQYVGSSPTNGVDPMGLACTFISRQITFDRDTIGGWVEIALTKDPEDLPETNPSLITARPSHDVRVKITRVVKDLYFCKDCFCPGSWGTDEIVTKNEQIVDVYLPNQFVEVVGEDLYKKILGKHVGLKAGTFGLYGLAENNDNNIVQQFKNRAQPGPWSPVAPPAKTKPCP